MIHIVRDIKIGMWRLYGIGCWHVGADGSNTGLCEWQVDEIKNGPTALAIIMGDLLDGILFDDKRFDGQQIQTKFTTINTAINECIRLLMPIRHKIVVMLKGNHETTIDKKIARSCYELIHTIYGTDGFKNGEEHPHISMLKKIANEGVSKYIADALGVPYGNYVCSVVFNMKHNGKTVKKISCVAHHGFGGGKKDGSSVNNLADLSSMFGDVDIVLFGHVHRMGTLPKTTINNKGGKPHQQVKALVLTPSSLETYKEGSVGYAEQKGYPPTNFGLCYASFDDYGVKSGGWEVYRKMK